MSNAKSSVKIEKFDYKVFELPEQKSVEIDLGCGDGSFTEALAKLHLDRIILAVDTLGGRLEKLRKKACRSGLQNLIIIKSEASFFIQIMLPDNSADAIHLLCPDPWPKEKHRFHRILSSEFAATISRKLKESGIFHFSTDHRPYFDSAKTIFNLNNSFEEIAIPTQLTPLKSDFELQWLSQKKEVKHLCWQKKISSRLPYTR